MSDDHNNDANYPAYNNTFYHDYIGSTGGSSTFPFFGSTSPMLYNQSSSSYDHHPSYLSFTDCLQGSPSDYNTLSGAFDKSCNSLSDQSARHMDNSSSENQNTCTTGAAAGNTTTTSVENPNSSVSCSSNEAGGEEGSSKSNAEIRTKGSEDGDDKSKKLSKPKKKGEKKPREPRFAFMTKSEVDHLEDGYRWRKYGQKAVKNSPFPRSYYRCTSQKCAVKKRVERSFQDPSVVITTYEGQHNHHCPATLRGNAAAMLSSSFLSSSNSSASPAVIQLPSFTSDFLNQMLPTTSRNDYPNPYYHQNLINLQQQQQQQQQQFQLPHDYNFFPEMNSSLFMHKPEP